MQTKHKFLTSELFETPPQYIVHETCTFGMSLVHCEKHSANKLTISAVLIVTWDEEEKN